VGPVPTGILRDLVVPDDTSDGGPRSGSQLLDRSGRYRGHDDGLVSNDDLAELDADRGQLCELLACFLDDCGQPCVAGLVGAVGRGAGGVNRQSGEKKPRARRGQGDDSIYKDGDRWRGAISVGYGPDGKRVRKKVSGQTREEVAKKLRQLREQLDAGLPVPDDRLSVGDFLDRWLSVNLPGHVAPSTLDDYADTVRLHLRPGLGRKRLTKLTVSDCDLLWKAKRDAGYSSNSVRIMRAVLRKALGQAEREGLIGRNVAALSGAPRVVAKEGAR
jgi:hypothetical protein